MTLRPMTLRAATDFVSEVHRHHKKKPRFPRGLFAVGVEHDGALVGVAIVGRPVSRMLQDGYTAEVTRVATDGTRNACSMLYGACRRACAALGYRRLFTYTLSTEGGASLHASDYRISPVESRGGKWSRPSRPRTDEHPTGAKVRWEAGL